MVTLILVGGDCKWCGLRRRTKSLSDQCCSIVQYYGCLSSYGGNVYSFYFCCSYEHVLFSLLLLQHEDLSLNVYRACHQYYNHALYSVQYNKMLTHSNRRYSHHLHHQRVLQPLKAVVRSRSGPFDLPCTQ